MDHIFNTVPILIYIPLPSLTANLQILTLLLKSSYSSSYLNPLFLNHILHRQRPLILFLAIIIGKFLCHQEHGINQNNLQFPTNSCLYMLVSWLHDQSYFVDNKYNQSPLKANIKLITNFLLLKKNKTNVLMWFPFIFGGGQSFLP